MGNLLEADTSVLIELCSCSAVHVIQDQGLRRVA